MATGPRPPSVPTADPAALLAAVFAAAPEPIFAKDRDGRYLMVNAAAQTLIGRPESDILGRTNADIWPERGFEAVLEADRRVLADGKVVEVEAVVPDSRMGRPRTYLVSKAPLRDGAGGIAGVVTVARDITAAHVADATLAERTAHLAEAQRIGRLGSWEWNLLTGEVTCSPELYRLHGLDPALPFPGAEAQRGTLYPDAAWAELDRAMCRARDVGEDFERELDALAAGETIRVVVRGEAVRDASGHVTRVRGTVQDVTARARAEAAAAEREARFRAVFENAAVGVARVAFEGERFLEVNAALCVITGYSRDELVGRSWVSITHPDDVEMDLAPFRRMATGELDSYSIEKRYIHKSGRHVWVRLTLSLVRDAAGRPDFEICVVEDVSAAKAAETRQSVLLSLSDRLREGETASRVVAEVLGAQFAVGHAGYGLVDPASGAFVVANQWIGDSSVEGVEQFELAAFGGWVLDDLSAGRAVVIADTQIDPRFDTGCDPLAIIGARAALIAPVMREGRLAAAVYLNSQPPREWTADEVQLVEEVAERAWAAVERDRAEAALRLSEERFRTVAEALPGLLFMAEPHAGNSYVNEAFRRFSGRSSEELAGQRWVEILHPDDLPAIRAQFGEAARTETHYVAEARFQRHDGEYRWHAIRGLPVRGRDGVIERWVGTATDIHDRRVAEDELRRLNDNLEREVARAVGEREEALQQLHEAQKLETIGQLTGGVAHDFNNLLTPVMGSLDLLRRRHDDERSRRLIDAALQSAERAKTLVQRLLAFARRQTLSPQPVDLGALIEGMRDLIERSLGPSIRVETAVEPGTCAVLADPNQLELALLNLAVNARDAMPRGGRLRIRIAPGEPPPSARLASGRYVRLCVEDEGEGMDAATLKRAIEPFFSTKAVGKGTGLGLSMVHGLAAQLSGWFNLESSVGEGTTATLWLPAAGQNAAPVAPPGTDTVNARGSARLLVVDDEDSVRASMADSLRDLGYEVTEAESAAVALAAVEGGLTPDLVVTDYMMAGATGTELTAQLRARRPGLPVLMTTGYARLTPEETRGIAVLPKPFRQSELARRVAETLEAARRVPG